MKEVYLNDGTLWSAQSDIDLVEGMARGDSIEAIATFIQYSPEECLRRFKELQGSDANAMFPKDMAAS
jgi:hypothetical protein